MNDAAAAPDEARSPLAGRRLLVPVTAARRAFADDLAGEGAAVTAVELIAIAGPEDPAPLAAATRAWLDGDYDWLAVTSRNAVLAMDALAREAGRSLAEPQPRARVATVGEATQAVCASVGLTVSLVPPGRADARGIVADLPDGPGRVLAPLGNLASPALVRGLERKGWDVTAVEAYRTVDGPGVDAATAAALAGGAFDAVLLTSGSVAERLAAACPRIGADTLVIAIGRTTAAGARGAGLRVDAVADAPTYRGIRDALLAALDRRPGGHA